MAVLRRSTPDDAHDVAPLILEAAPYLRLLLGGAHEAWHAAEACYRGERTMFGARFGMVAEEDAVVGVVMAFPGRLWASLKLGTGVALARSAGVIHATELVKRGRVLDRLHLPVPRETLYVSALAVHPDHRRKGLARALVGRAVVGAGRLGLGVSLDVDLDRVPARALYRSLGFEEIGIRETNAVERDLLGTAGLVRLVLPLGSAGRPAPDALRPASP